MGEQEQRAAVVAEARTWLGTKWHHAARIKGAGVDCGQLLIAVYEAVGVVKAADPGSYPQDWALHRSEERFLKTVEQYAKKIPEGQTPQPGDIALFKYGRCISHAGIVVAYPTIIHAYLNVGKVMEDDLERNGDLKSRYVGAWSPWQGNN